MMQTVKISAPMWYMQAIVGSRMNAAIGGCSEKAACISGRHAQNPLDDGLGYNLWSCAGQRVQMTTDPMQTLHSLDTLGS